ncbi:hypothetical protein KSP40_PGU006156 [Platanthera guangdongensis]|uniref:Uncharacterized protein n=1 Tax=Platanthera guangdongensis TaxID=2320717 RepID=A0ABR2MBH6_9ASPA
MIRGGGIAVCLLIIAMDIVAGVLGIEAEIAQGKGKHLRVLIFECKEPVRAAYRLGLAAAVILAAAHLAANLLGGCTCIFSREEFERSSANRQRAAATLAVSWVIVLLGFSLLMIAAMSNTKSKATCGFGHRHFLSVGGILCFVHSVFCVAYYSSATASWEEGKPISRPQQPHP